ncbi:MAG: flagellar basal-body rod protein FlgG [Kiritimatiellae bacterium]|nr:flagellar basal-body rod protein FlgG [Kiritimatiellia bacterium]MDD4734550.1 flagellar basal-body rod protein FlgG [Kiritimatiellia bacterium]
MERSLWAGVSGMRAQELALDTIANNLANINTTGYKPSRISFEDMLYSTLITPGAESGDAQIPNGIQIGHGTKVSEIAKVFRQGSLKETGRDLDFAVEGEGFFEVTLPDGTAAYTRDGNFRSTSTGEVVTVDGYRVTGFDNIPEGTTEVTVAPDGSFTVIVNGDPVQLAQVTLVRFQNPEGLRSIGRNLFTESEGSGAPQAGMIPGEEGMGTIAHKYTEASAVNAAEELVHMILSQRAYEANSKTIKAADEMEGIANTLRR